MLGSSPDSATKKSPEILEVFAFQQPPHLLLLQMLVFGLINELLLKLIPSNFIFMYRFNDLLYSKNGAIVVYYMVR